MSPLRTPSAEDVQMENVLIGLSAIVDVVEDLRAQIEKMRHETREAIREHVRCYEECEATIEGLAHALRQGWIDIGIDELDDDSFVGWCVECQAKHEEVERKLNGGPVHPQPVLETPAKPAKKPETKTPGVLFDTFPID